MLFLKNFYKITVNLFDLVWHVHAFYSLVYLAPYIDKSIGATSILMPQETSICDVWGYLSKPSGYFFCTI